MSRLTILLTSSAVLALVFVQLGTCLDVERICERRCLYGRGGILCRCNAMHFTGKRSSGGHSVAAISRYRGDHLGKSAYAKSSGIDSSIAASSGRHLGSSKSFERSRNSITSQAASPENWNTDRLRRFFDNLRTLAHESRFLGEAKKTPKSKLPKAALYSGQPLYTFASWTGFPVNQDGSQNGDAELRQSAESSQNFAVNYQRRVSQEVGDEDVDESLTEDEENTSPEQQVEIQQLQNVLRKALGGR